VWVILAFDAPEAVLRERVRQRAERGDDASEAGVEVLAAQLAQREPLAGDEIDATLRIETTEPVSWSALLPALDALLEVPQRG
jgi:predicted kinase